MKTERPGSAYNILAFIFPGWRQVRSFQADPVAKKKFTAHGVIATSLVEVDDEGKPHFHPAGRSSQATAIGILTGGILGLIGGPEGLLVWTVLGAVIGSQVGKRLDGPIPLADLQRLATHMQPDTSAILALLKKVQTQALIDDMAGYGAQVVQLRVNDDV